MMVFMLPASHRTFRYTTQVIFADLFFPLKVRVMFRKFREISEINQIHFYDF